MVVLLFNKAVDLQVLCFKKTVAKVFLYTI